MLPIEYRIENEDESVTLDFKKEAYGKKTGEFLKDVAAFANALTNDLNRYIVIGVKDQNGMKEYFNVNRNDIGDVSNFQQLIDQNIEPNIPIKIKYVNIEENELAVFEIGPCDNPPYVFKKDYPPTKQGIIYIRNGTSTRFAKRQELDLMYQRRDKVQSKDISVGFIDAIESSIELRVLNSGEINNAPSNIRKRAIENEIKHRKSPYYMKPLVMASDFSILRNEKPLSRLDDSELQQMLLDVKKEFIKNDNYYFYEEVGNRFNLFIHNQGAEPLVGCTIKLKVPIVNGLKIAGDVYDDPTDFSRIITMRNFVQSQYPQVGKTENMYIITEKIAKLKHKLTTKVFLEDIRIVFLPEFEEKEITIQYEIYADNYHDVISGDLSIKVVRN
ncbi:ATP-binding protein (plasmid) [Ureibacillus chungkukjangi]|uniref:AlbA family DNA-binding domain-containing protein n=1 Tax=Ureibacillus chungkukjangi TaxID=1202712 RepID=UPI000D3990D3|nr:ATP-binding protein [Ureibacillus chungkukjangi]MCM3390690.1 ATP-binding protein [Ureibacillus chungkukjangi]